MAKVVPIGEPVNPVERDAIAFLRDGLPDSYTVFHNVEIADVGRAPLEYDIVVLGEHAVYTVEVKGYRGRVTGNKRDWYVDGRHRRSPLPATFQKARVFSSRMRRAKRRIGPVWVEALVFLANRHVDPHFGEDVAEHVYTFDGVLAALTDRHKLHLPHWPVKPPSQYAPMIEQFLLGGRPAPARTHVGSFRLLEEIGRTAYFTDFEAVNDALLSEGERELPVRLRLYPIDPYAPSDQADQQRQRGRWEASVLRLLGPHEGLVNAGDPFFPEAEDLALALPFAHAEGVTLSSYLETYGPIAPVDLVDRLGSAISGLGMAHSRGVIHRRITPDAFLCSEVQPFRLGDFAFSSMAESGDRPEWTVPLDTHPAYSAPEVLAGGEATAASDVFSLGMILWQALLGRRPIARVAAAVWPPKDEDLGVSDPAFAALLTQMLAADPAARPQFGYDVLERLASNANAGGLFMHLGQERLLGPGAVVNESYTVLERVGPPRTRTSYAVTLNVAEQRRLLRTFCADDGELAEARVAFQRCYELQHPCLARFHVLDRLRTPATRVPKPIYFIDLEFVPGVPASALIESGGIGVRRSLGVAQQVGGLLAYLAREGLHHGGVDGGSVFVGHGDQVKVARPPAVLPRVVLSPLLLRYADPTVSPEAADVRALAVLTWELATGAAGSPHGNGRPGLVPVEGAEPLFAVLKEVLSETPSIDDVLERLRSLDKGV